jgi:hypothetical protein
VIPKEGYRTTDVKLSVIDPGRLDYDNGTCNDIQFRVCSRHVFLPSLGGNEDFSRTHSSLMEFEPVTTFTEFSCFGGVKIAHFAYEEVPPPCTLSYSSLLWP